MTYETIWTIEMIKEGFEKFYELNGKYPTAFEIDDYSLLPSSRQIQRRFGGLVNLRKQLNLPINDYTVGESRSSVSSKISKRGKNCENMMLDVLKEHFKEQFIHIERPIRNYEYKSKERFDFFVFAKPKNFAIDVFGTDGDIRHLIKIMNIKEKKYINASLLQDELLYFIYFGKNISNNDVNKWIERRKNNFPSNWKIFSFNKFNNELSKYSSYSVL